MMSFSVYGAATALAVSVLLLDFTSWMLHKLLPMGLHKGFLVAGRIADGLDEVITFDDVTDAANSKAAKCYSAAAADDDGMDGSHIESEVQCIPLGGDGDVCRYIFKHDENEYNFVLPKQKQANVKRMVFAIKRQYTGLKDVNQTFHHEFLGSKCSLGEVASLGLDSDLFVTNETDKYKTRFFPLVDFRFLIIFTLAVNISSMANTNQNVLELINFILNALVLVWILMGANLRYHVSLCCKWLLSFLLRANLGSFFFSFCVVLDLRIYPCDFLEYKIRRKEIQKFLCCSKLFYVGPIKSVTLIPDLPFQDQRIIKWPRLDFEIDALKSDRQNSVDITLKVRRLLFIRRIMRQRTSSHAYRNWINTFTYVEKETPDAFVCDSNQNDELHSLNFLQVIEQFSRKESEFYEVQIEPQTYLLAGFKYTTYGF